MTSSTIAWGWLATGVLALGVNGFMHDEGADLARRVANRVVSRSGVMAALASGRADWLLARTQTLAMHEQTQSCRVGSAVAHIQSQIAGAHAGFTRMEAMSAREQAQLARLQANRARIEAQAVRVQLTTADFNVSGIPHFSTPQMAITCPRVRVKIPRPMAKIPEPTIRVRVAGAGSI